MLALTALLYVLVSLKYRAGGGVGASTYSQVPQGGEDEGPSFGTFTL